MHQVLGDRRSWRDVAGCNPAPPSGARGFESLLTHQRSTRLSDFPKIGQRCERGGIGRHTALRLRRLTAMGVRVPLSAPSSSEWWNWQTHQSQKLTVNSHEGSSPSSDTNIYWNRYIYWAVNMARVVDTGVESRICERGGIGRHKGLRSPRLTAMQVRCLSLAPSSVQEIAVFTQHEQTKILNTSE
jgi:hypothetical protein